jgi:hypothetical protein
MWIVGDAESDGLNASCYLAEQNLASTIHNRQSKIK